METVFLSLSVVDFQALIAETVNACLRRTPQAISQPVKELGYLTRKETCKRLGGISLPTLNEYTKTGRIKGNRIGRRVLYSPSDIDAALTAIKTKSGGTKL